MPQDVVDLILNDHHELKAMFKTLLDQPERRITLVPVMTTLLTAHSRAEESAVYPAAVKAGEGHDVEHSQQEHLVADELALKLSKADPHSDDFVETLKELIHAVEHHLEEEEETLLPSMRHEMEPTRLVSLGEDFLAARAALLGEQPEDMTKEQLEQQAANLDLPGRSSMSKQELKENLKGEAEL